VTDIEKVVVEVPEDGIDMLVAPEYTLNELHAAREDNWRDAIIRI
jgi:hypothetical protein